MWQGEVISIFIAPEAAAPPHALEAVRAVPGQGLEGDRYFKKTGTFSQNPGTGREVTLIAAEELEAVQRDYGVQLSPAESRRNIVTSGVPLNFLVGREFRIGEVTLRGVRLCEPCDHLASLTDQRVLRGMVHRGGLRADIVTEGTIRTGDRVTEA